jgi:hypothetical protein
VSWAKANDTYSASNSLPCEGAAGPQQAEENVITQPQAATQTYKASSG